MVWWGDPDIEPEGLDPWFISLCWVVVVIFPPQMVIARPWKCKEVPHVGSSCPACLHCAVGALPLPGN